MTIGFDTKNKSYDKIKAGTHPYDKTVRPQFLSKGSNPSYYNLIDEFLQINRYTCIIEY